MPVSDGAAAVAAMNAAAEPFALVLVDIHMPGMDGEEAMRQMRQMGYRGALVALTAHPQAEEESRWRAAGCDAVAPKPIDRRTFIPMLAALLRAKTAAVGRTAADA